MLHSHASAQVFLRNLAALQSLNTLKTETDRGTLLSVHRRWATVTSRPHVWSFDGNGCRHAVRRGIAWRQSPDRHMQPISLGPSPGARPGVLHSEGHGNSFHERVTACQVPRADRGAHQQRSACSPSAILQCTYHVEKLHKSRTLAQYTTTTSQSQEHSG